MKPHRLVSLENKNCCCCCALDSGNRLSPCTLLISVELHAKMTFAIARSVKAAGFEEPPKFSSRYNTGFLW